MTIEKRKRGRPLGSCKDDSPLLRQVADILVLDKKLKPTTAIKRVLASPNPSPIRRLQSKWKQDGSKYVREAQTRATHRAAEQRDRAIAVFSERERTFTNGIFGSVTSKAVQDVLGISASLNTYEMIKMQSSQLTAAQLAKDAVKAIFDQQQERERKRLAEMLYGSFMGNGAAKAFKEAEQLLISEQLRIFRSRVYNLNRLHGTI